MSSDVIVINQSIENDLKNKLNSVYEKKEDEENSKNINYQNNQNSHIKINTENKNDNKDDPKGDLADAENENINEFIVRNDLESGNYNEFQILNENVLNDEDDIKNAIQEIDTVSETTQNDKKHIDIKQIDNDDYIMDELTDKKNNSDNIQSQDSAMSNQNNKKNLEIQEDKNCKYLIIKVFKSLIFKY